MKISIVITEGAKQIMLTPETKHEKEAIKYIAPDDTLQVVKRTGTFYNDHGQHAQFQISECRGEYYRIFSTEESIMFVIKEKKEKSSSATGG